MEELCWEGLPVGPNIFITQDLLHGCYKFIWDHLAEWLNHTIGEKELDFQFKAQPKLGFLTFSNGITKISQATRCKHWTYLQYIISIIAECDRLDRKVLLAVRSLVDYIFMAHYPLISVTQLEVMETALSEFHANKHIFIENGS